MNASKGVETQRDVVILHEKAAKLRAAPHIDGYRARGNYKAEHRASSANLPASLVSYRPLADGYRYETY